MASSVRLIRPASSLARQSSHHPLPALHHSLPATLLPIRRTFASTAIIKDKSSDSGVANNNYSSSTTSNKNGSDTDPVKAKGILSSAEAESAEAAAAAERQRVIAQDATLKEILESAAAEKKKLEEELVRKQRLAAEQEQRRQAALKEAAEAAQKAEAEAIARAKAVAEAEKKKSQQGATDISVGSSQGSTVTNSVSESTLGSGTAAERLEQSLASVSSKDSTKNTSSATTNSTPSASSPANSNAKGAAIEYSSTSSQRDNEFIDDPLEPFRARLLPYKKSLASSTEYIRSSLPDSLRQLQESVKRKDYRDLISQLSEHLNNFTGYTAINDLKSKVIAYGDSLDKARISLLQSKQAYEDAIGTRSDTQKAINDLLQRKHLWSPDDVIRFTDLYRSEHANEQAELKTKNEYKQAEANVEEKSRRLTRVIMERYHEEQVWSDKIRAASTYGTWGLVGVNVMAFLIVQAFVEPRRRRKQVERYEELVEDLTERGILPDKTVMDSASIQGATNPAVANGTREIPGTASPIATSTDKNSSVGAVAIGGALLGGEDVLLKMIESAERQEERLGRMEAILIKSSFQEGPDGNSNPAAMPTSTPSYVVAEDGTILFIPESEEEENFATEGFVLDGDERVVFGALSGGSVSSGIVEDKGRFRTDNRIKRMLTDGGQEVLATRRDFLISGLGGAIIGGLVTVAVMMYR